MIRPKIVSEFFSSLFLALVYLFLYLPILVLIIYSFNARGFPAAWDSFTLQWYRDLFSAGDLWSSFGCSFFVAITSTFLSLLMGLFFTFLIAQRKKYQSKTSLFYGNLVIPETVLALALVSYFNALDIPMGLSTVIVSHTLLGLGFVIPVMVIRCAQIDRRLFEASMVLGATAFQTFRKVTLPLLKPSMIASGVLIFVISFDDYILAYFCSGSSMPTFSVYLASSIRYGISPILNALSSFMLILTIGLGLIFFSLKRGTRIFG